MREMGRRAWTVDVQLRRAVKTTVDLHDVTVKILETTVIWLTGVVLTGVVLGTAVTRAVAVVVTVTVTVVSSTSTSSGRKTGLATAKAANAKRPSVLKDTILVSRNQKLWTG